jgi:membrane-associated phospholipid phosphatase
MPRLARIVLISVVAIVLAHLLDPWAWTHLVDPEVYERDRGRLFRIVGYLPLWLALGVALWMHTRDRRRALLLALVPALGGLLAEVLKILLRRERPGLHDGEYYFRAFSDQPFSTKVLGLPSSHVLVAFAGAWTLARLYPRAAPIWLAFAMGCALSRVQAHAHFLSDTVVAAVAGFALVEVVWRQWGGGLTTRAALDHSGSG